MHGRATPVKAIDRLKREYRFVSRLLRVLRRVNDIDPKANRLVCDDFEAVCDKHYARTAMVFEGKSLTYQQFDQMANRYAHWARAQNLKRGDVVALFMPNRLEYIPIWLGLNKLGVVTALVNNALSGQSLVHCLNISGAGTCLVDATTREAYETVRDQLGRKQQLWSLDLTQDQETDHRRNLDRNIKSMSMVRPDQGLRADMTSHDLCLYIYTSGTTGMPKAARITNARAQLYMQAFAAVSDMGPNDCVYNVLPLYHATGGLCGVGAALMNGGRVVLKRKFSATQFWADIRREGCTHIVYIGELCRYLINSPPSPEPSDETQHKVRLAFGNGMRPEVWEPFQKRFHVKNIVEFYGATEGNVSLFNLDGHPGAIGRVPSYLKSKFNIRLVSFDVEQEMPERRIDGLCREARVDEIGEAIGLIGQDVRHDYSGYADKAASEKKILNNVFKRGDTWFRTGDLMRQDKDGYLYFVDRIGDTFRFKGENVSTSEVAEHAASAQGIAEAIIYGVEVPHNDGKVGMAALSTREGFDMALFYAHLQSRLPDYAVPRFVRLLTAVETTGTFKYKKNDLVKDGFDPATITDPLYVLVDHAYVALSPELKGDIEAGRVRL
jgi:fatty-acyl-CoA synthase